MDGNEFVVLLLVRTSGAKQECRHADSAVAEFPFGTRAQLCNAPR